MNTIDHEIRQSVVNVTNATTNLTAKKNSLDLLYQEQNTYVPDEMIIPEEYTMETEKIKRIGEDGNPIPDVCPVCGAKVSLYLKGEPVWLCSNSKCRKYFGVAKFTQPK